MNDLKLKKVSSLLSNKPHFVFKNNNMMCKKTLDNLKNKINTSNAVFKINNLKNSSLGLRNGMEKVNNNKKCNKSVYIEDSIIKQKNTVESNLNKINKKSDRNNRNKNYFNKSNISRNDNNSIITNTRCSSAIGPKILKNNDVKFTNIKTNSRNSNNSNLLLFEFGKKLNDFNKTNSLSNIFHKKTIKNNYNRSYEIKSKDCIKRDKLYNEFNLSKYIINKENKTFKMSIIDYNNNMNKYSLENKIFLNKLNNSFLNKPKSIELNKNNINKYYIDNLKTSRLSKNLCTFIKDKINSLKTNLILPKRNCSAKLFSFNTKEKMIENTKYENINSRLDSIEKKYNNLIKDLNIITNNSIINQSSSLINNEILQNKLKINDFATKKLKLSIINNLISGLHSLKNKISENKNSNNDKLNINKENVNLDTEIKIKRLKDIKHLYNSCSLKYNKTNVCGTNHNLIKLIKNCDYTKFKNIVKNNKYDILLSNKKNMFDINKINLNKIFDNKKFNIMSNKYTNGLESIYYNINYCKNLNKNYNVLNKLKAQKNEKIIHYFQEETEENLNLNNKIIK